MKIPVWLLNYNLIKAATAKLFISAQINYNHEISGKSAKGFGRTRRQIWCCGVQRWMPGKDKNLISLLKSAQRCWRIGIYINSILKSQEGSIQRIRGKMGPHRNKPQVETPKVLVLLLMLQPENCYQGNPGNEENQVVPPGFGAQTGNFWGWAKGVLCLPHTGFHPLRKHHRDLR